MEHLNAIVSKRKQTIGKNHKTGGTRLIEFQQKIYKNSFEQKELGSNPYEHTIKWNKTEV